jgi:hypothetical protein
MFPHGTAREQNEYRIVLVRSGSHAIWTKHESDRLRLPRVAIPRWTRMARQLQQAIESVWGIRVVILDILPHGEGSAPCAIAEILSSESVDGLAAVGMDEIAREEMTSKELEVLKAVLSGRVGRGPFSRVGWINEATDWISTELGHKNAVIGEVCQYNASPSFALVRFAMHAGPAYWLKATGEPNAHEFKITRLLTKLCPGCLPGQIGVREDWNAWLMEDAGQPLESWTLPALEKAVSSMAMLQAKMLGQTKNLMAAGACDQRVLVLREYIAGLVEYLDEIMMKQSSTRVLPIGYRRLEQIASIVRDACLCMEMLEIPDTPVHNDMNSGNILFHGTDCVFTDWCEIGVGNPFLTFQYLCLLKPRDTDYWIPSLHEIYKECWLGYLSPSQIDRAFALMPVLAILACLCWRGVWLHSARRHDSHVESYARSLARHLDRATQDPRLLEVLGR